jgi:hypothetical protein
VGTKKPPAWMLMAMLDLLKLLRDQNLYRALGLVIPPVHRGIAVVSSGPNAPSIDETAFTSPIHHR